MCQPCCDTELSVFKGKGAQHPAIYNKVYRRSTASKLINLIQTSSYQLRPAVFPQAPNSMMTNDMSPFGIRFGPKVPPCRKPTEVHARKLPPSPQYMNSFTPGLISLLRFDDFALIRKCQLLNNLRIFGILIRLLFSLICLVSPPHSFDR